MTSRNSYVTKQEELEKRRRHYKITVGLMFTMYSNLPGCHLTCFLLEHLRGLRREASLTSARTINIPIGRCLWAQRRRDGRIVFDFRWCVGKVLGSETLAAACFIAISLMPTSYTPKYGDYGVRNRVDPHSAENPQRV